MHLHRRCSSSTRWCLPPSAELAISCVCPFCPLSQLKNDDDVLIINIQLPLRVRFRRLNHDNSFFRTQTKRLIAPDFLHWNFFLSFNNCMHPTRFATEYFYTIEDRYILPNKHTLSRVSSSSMQEQQHHLAVVMRMVQQKQLLLMIRRNNDLTNNRTDFPILWP